MNKTVLKLVKGECDPWHCALVLVNSHVEILNADLERSTAVTCLLFGFGDCST